LVIPFICWFKVNRVLLCVDGVFRAEVDAVGNKGPGDTKMVDDVQTHTLRGLFEHVPEIWLFQ